MKSKAMKIDLTHTEIARMLPVKLTDGSIAYNVEIRANGAKVVLAATSRRHALALCAEINECSWAEAV